MPTRTFLSRLDFFNPLSRTGNFYSDDPDHTPMQTVQSQIFPTNYNRGIFFNFQETWNLLTGQHYTDKHDQDPTAKKGLLDFLIFPMLPLMLVENQYSDYYSLIVMFSVVFLEFIRALAAVILFVPTIIALNIGFPIFAIGYELFAFAMQQSSPNPDSSEEICGQNIRDFFGLYDSDDDSYIDEEVIFKLPTYGSINNQYPCN